MSHILVSNIHVSQILQRQMYTIKLPTGTILPDIVYIYDVIQVKKYKVHPEGRFGRGLLHTLRQPTIPMGIMGPLGCSIAIQIPCCMMPIDVQVYLKYTDAKPVCMKPQNLHQCHNSSASNGHGDWQESDPGVDAGSTQNICLHKSLPGSHYNFWNLAHSIVSGSSPKDWFVIAACGRLQFRGPSISDMHHPAQAIMAHLHHNWLPVVATWVIPKQARLRLN